MGDCKYSIILIVLGLTFLGVGYYLLGSPIPMNTYFFSLGLSNADEKGFIRDLHLEYDFDKGESIISSSIFTNSSVVNIDYPYSLNNKSIILYLYGTDRLLEEGQDYTISNVKIIGGNNLSKKIQIIFLKENLGDLSYYQKNLNLSIIFSGKMSPNGFFYFLVYASGNVFSTFNMQNPIGLQSERINFKFGKKYSCNIECAKNILEKYPISYILMPDNSIRVEPSEENPKNVYIKLNTIDNDREALRNFCVGLGISLISAGIVILVTVRRVRK